LRNTEYLIPGTEMKKAIKGSPAGIEPAANCNSGGVL
jgi:hypothetical protein